MQWSPGNLPTIEEKAEKRRSSEMVPGVGRTFPPSRMEKARRGGSRAIGSSTSRSLYSSPTWKKTRRLFTFPRAMRRRCGRSIVRRPGGNRRRGGRSRDAGRRDGHPSAEAGGDEDALRKKRRRGRRGGRGRRKKAPAVGTSLPSEAFAEAGESAAPFPLRQPAEPPGPPAGKARGAHSPHVRRLPEPAPIPEAVRPVKPGSAGTQSAF